MSEFELRLFTREFAEDVRSLLLNSFFLHEPLNERFGFDLPDEVEDFIEVLIDTTVKDQCSFVFLDGKRLTAMCLNVIKSKNDHDHNDPFQSSTLRYIYKMLGQLQEQQTVFDYLQVDRVLYTAVISVDPNYRGQRLSEKLLEKSLEYAKNQLNLRGAYTETTSFFSQKAFLKMGFEKINEIVYETYDKEKLSKMEIHDRCSLVVRRLD